jgi:excisionase family DNA binding protein
MIKIKVAEKALSLGFKNPFALQNALNLSPTVAARLWKGKFRKIGIDTLLKLCDLFKCQVDELLFYTGEVNKGTEIGFEADKGVERLTTNEIASLMNLSRKRVNDFINQGKLRATKTVKGHNVIDRADFQAFLESRKFA